MPIPFFSNSGLKNSAQTLWPFKSTIEKPTITLLTDLSPAKGQLYDRKSKGETYLTYEIAMVESDRKNEEKALDLLEAAFRRQDWNFVFITVDLEFKSLENKPRFRKLLQRVGYTYVQ